MNKKFLVIIAIAIVLIGAGVMLIISNPGTVTESSQITLKPHDFKLFEMDIPDGSNFTVKNEADGMKFYKNKGNYSSNFSSIILSKNMTDSLIGVNIEPISNSSAEKIYSFQLKNKTNYKLVSIHDDVDIILIGQDLNLLKEISSSIVIKDVDSL